MALWLIAGPPSLVSRFASRPLNRIRRRATFAIYSLRRSILNDARAMVLATRRRHAIERHSAIDDFAIRDSGIGQGRVSVPAQMQMHVWSRETCSSIGPDETISSFDVRRARIVHLK
jgi:hypothetical protein